MSNSIAFSIKNNAELTLRAFSSKRSARNYGNGQQVFCSIEELVATRLKDDDLRAVYRGVTGFETKVRDREYLCELLFNAIIAADFPLTDTDMDFSIALKKEEKVTDQEVEVVAATESAPAKEKKAPKRKLDLSSDDPAVAFGVIPGSNRAKALEVLWSNKGKSVPISEIIKSVYGSDDVKKNLGAASLVVKGLILSASKEGVKFAVTKSGKGANVEYTIDSK